MEKVLQLWLDHQCRILTGSRHAVLLNGPPDQGPYDQILFWPDHHHDLTMLTRVAQKALRDKKTVIKSLSNKGGKTVEPLDALACPLFLGDKLLGVVAIERTHHSLSNQRAAIKQVQTGAKWLEAMIELPLDPALGSKKIGNGLMAKSVFEPVQRRTAKLFGPNRLPLILGVGVLAVLLMALFSMSTLLRVPSDSASETVNRYAVVAPQQRYSIKPIEALSSIKIGPIIREQELKKATSILHGNGIDFQQVIEMEPIKVTRLLEGLYPPDKAQKRFKTIQHIVDSAFMIPEKGKIAIYVATYHDRAKAIQRLKQLAQKNLKVTAVATELKRKGTILVANRVDQSYIETITDQMSKLGLSVHVFK